MEAVALFVIAAAGILLYTGRRRLLRRRQAAYIDGYRFPETIPDKVRAKYPHLSNDQLSSVMAGLREYFQICNLAGRKMVSMPSQAVDVAWHEFILFTRLYREFCRNGLGRFLDHTPAEAMESPTKAQTGIRRAWRLACFGEGIRPLSADKLPLLFAMDAMLGIPDGFRYSLDCLVPGSHPYCAGHIGCSSGCAGDGDGGGDGGCGGGD